jgi:hypothetical protein
LPLLVLALLSIAQPVWACCSCVGTVNATQAVEWPETTRQLKDTLTTERTTQQVWSVGVMWEDNLLPAMMMLANQLSATSLMQTMMIGTMIDAKHQMETQRTLQTIRAQAHKDYHPSAGMCEFGSTVKSLAASERKAELTAHVLAQRSQDRQLGNANSSAAPDPDADQKNRLKQYKEKFCDPSDNNNGLKELCGTGASKPERMNKDIDYARTVDFPWTLEIDFTDTTLTDNEEEVLALASNLYGERVFPRVAAAKMKESTGGQINADQSDYIDMRAIIAKRSVAENSYNAITGMKASGTAGSREYLEAVLKELGVTDAAVTTDGVDALGRMLGHKSGSNTKIPPSYYAQMEVLTKKIYQNPDFYTNLYDKPANVERKTVAMQAIGLMQKFDYYKSILRTEANLSVLLELAVEDVQNDIENQLSSQDNQPTGLAPQ